MERRAGTHTSQTIIDLLNKVEFEAIEFGGEVVMSTRGESHVGSQGEGDSTGQGDRSAPEQKL